MTAEELESSTTTGTSVLVANHPSCHKFSDKRDSPSSSNKTFFGNSPIAPTKISENPCPLRALAADHSSLARFILVRKQKDSPIGISRSKEKISPMFSFLGNSFLSIELNAADAIWKAKGLGMLTLDVHHEPLSFLPRSSFLIGQSHIHVRAGNAGFDTMMQHNPENTIRS